ncbi:hypothetical protein WISP_86763 [Willisornis vidua]|uniref:Uncharacterized protein n=1 Tax=Willisornis vidua TaxID=1566151 RepID=A0ABQ9D8S4_9PASS|nr:hypothetical protein WISP_86763 [Willisornis vidua]
MAGGGILYKALLYARDPGRAVGMDNWLPELVDRDGEQNNPTVIQEEVVSELLAHLDPYKSMGPGQCTEYECVTQSAVTFWLLQKPDGNSQSELGSILCPLLFNTFLNHLDAGLEGIQNKFADDTKIGGAVDSLEGREAVQIDLNKSDDWAITNHRKFINGKCQVLHLGQVNPKCMYRLQHEMMESSTTEKDLGILDEGTDKQFESLLVRIKGQANMGDTNVGVYYRPPDQEEEVCMAFYGQLEIALWSQALVLLGNFNHPDICRGTEDSFLMQVMEEPMRKGVLLDLVLTNQTG